MNPKVSITIPIYKPNFVFLNDLIDSIKKQSYSNIEIIISDDYPSEENFMYFQQFIDLDIRYIHNESGVKGIFGNLNNAINHAKGDLIQIFCQDDVMFPNFIECQVNSMIQEENIGMVVAKSEPIDCHGNIVEAFKKGYTKLKATRINPDKAINYFFVFGCFPGNLSPVMLRKSAIDKVGLFNQQYPYGGDFEYWIRMGLHFSIIYQRKTLLYIRRHGNTASATLGLNSYWGDVCKIYERLKSDNTVKYPFTIKMLYIHQKLFRQIMGDYRRNKWPLKNIFTYFDGKPYSLFWAILSGMITGFGFWEIELNEDRI